jgi:hypothetical protein
MTRIEVRGRAYERIPVKTHVIGIKEPLEPVLDQYVRPLLQPGDWITIAESVVSISQGRVVHQSVIRKPSLLARFIILGVKDHPGDIGYKHAAKMQVAIMQAGGFRMFCAMVLGGLSRLILRRHGDFYRIAGNGVAQIDGFNPPTLPPFNEYAVLGPDAPDETSAKLAAHLGCPVAILDANNIAITVLGSSRDFPVDRDTVRRALGDNPSGQNHEQTPIVIVRAAG